MASWFMLIVSAYIIGSLPVSYLAAKWAKGIDLRKYGTGQVGGGNLWRMTASWKIGLPVGLYDGSKGLFMMLAARAAGLDLAQQIVTGLAAIAGHNWSVFLKFSGGRGVGTALGIIFILPFIAPTTLWITLTFFIIAVITIIFLHRSPVPILLGVVSLPITSLALNQPPAVTLALLGIPFIIILKRLIAQRSPEASSLPKNQLLLNRLLFDRDIRDRQAWLYRAPIEGKAKIRSNQREERENSKS